MYAEAALAHRAPGRGREASDFLRFCLISCRYRARTRGYRPTAGRYLGGEGRYRPARARYRVPTGRYHAAARGYH